MDTDTAVAEPKVTSVKNYIDKLFEEKVSDEVDRKMKELAKHAAKDRVIAKREGATSEDKELVKQWYKALATGRIDSPEMTRVNDLIETDYKQKDQNIGTIGSGTSGGVLVPTTVADSIISQMFYISPMRKISTVIENLPANFQLPSETTLVQAYWVAEGAPGTSSGEVFAPNLLTPNKLMGLDGFTSEILADAATNPSIQNYVERRFAVALALLENSGFVNGSGSGMPWGFRSSAITPNTVAQANDVLVYTDVTGLKYAIPTAYRQRAVFVTSSAGALALENVKDNYGRPIWRNGLAEDNPPTLSGRPIFIVDEIPTNLGTGGNATELWFGMFENYFIGDRGDLRVDYGTNGTDFANDKISLRVAKRVAGRPTIQQGFGVLGGVIAGS